jgi:DNA-binding GntR family transcriptional regulator
MAHFAADMASSARSSSARLAEASVEPLRAPPSLTLQAYTRIEDMIAKLELRPGQALSEAGLSTMLGIGRTPVREALQRLAREHLVQVLPQRGILVTQIDIKMQLRLLETRREVERLIMTSAARRCAQAERERFHHLAQEFTKAGRADDPDRFMRADKEFNDLSLIAARNEFTAAAMGLMHGLSRRFWYLHHQQADDLRGMARLHADIAAAIAKADEKAAAQALDALIDHNEAFTRSTVSTDF